MALSVNDRTVLLMAKMTKKQLNQFRTQLEAESRELLGMEYTLSAETVYWSKFSASDQRTRDPNEADHSVTERAILAKLADSNSSAANEVLRALGKITDGTYGVCDKCGKNIPLPRLEVRPRATICVACS